MSKRKPEPEQANVTGSGMASAIEAALVAYAREQNHPIVELTSKISAAIAAKAALDYIVALGLGERQAT